MINVNLTLLSFRRWLVMITQTMNR